MAIIRAGHWGLAGLAMSIGLASILSPVPQPESMGGCASTSTAPALRSSPEVSIHNVASPRPPRDYPWGLPGRADLLPDRTRSPGPDKTVVITFCYSSSSELEWNEKLHKRLKTQLMAERTETKRDATSLELEIGLKSILGELPPSGWAVQVYFVTDSKAAGRVGAMLDRTGLNGSTWPVPISITIIDVNKMVRTMRQVIQTTVAFRDYRTYHAFGQWFRFFLPWVIPVHVTHTIYVDPDVWFVSSIAALWGERDPGAMLQWGDESKCSGTMILNLAMMRTHFWEVNLNSACQFVRPQLDAFGYATKNYSNADAVKDGQNGDQAVLRRLYKTYPELFGNLSRSFDIAIANGAWRYGDNIADAFPAAGTLHSNGGGPNNQRPYWEHDFFDKRPKGWSLVYFYVELPWRWMVSRGAAAASDGSGGAGAPLALRLMPTLRLEQTPAFLAAMAPTKGHPDCATHCSSQGERQARTSFKPGVNATCDRCVCAKTGVTSLTAKQQLALRMCDAARERKESNADACKRLDETPDLVKQWGIRLCDTNSAVPCPET